TAGSTTPTPWTRSGRGSGRSRRSRGGSTSRAGSGRRGGEHRDQGAWGERRAGAPPCICRRTRSRKAPVRAGTVVPGGRRGSGAARAVRPLWADSRTGTHTSRPRLSRATDRLSPDVRGAPGMVREGAPRIGRRREGEPAAVTECAPDGEGVSWAERGGTAQGGAAAGGRRAGAGEESGPG